MTRPATLDEARARLARLDGGIRLDTERTPPSWTAYGYGVGRGDGETWEAAWDAMVDESERRRAVVLGLDDSPPPADPALLAAANRALHAEVEALRRQVAELTALGVSLHKAAAAGMADERAAIVAWIRGLYAGESKDDAAVGLLRVVAAQVESGAHRP